MNLFYLLQKELESKNISDPVLIARYIYIRTGELFEYNPSYDVVSLKQQQELTNENPDPQNITSFNYICYSWSNLYCSLLKLFGINAELVDKLCHRAVKYTIDNQEYYADLMKDFGDVFRIKFGLKTLNNYPVGEENNKEQIVAEWDQKIGYRKSIKTEAVLEQLKQELQAKYPKEEDYIYNTYKVVQYLLNVPRNGVGHVSGRNYIRYLLSFFLEDKFQSCTSRIYNVEKSIYIQVYGVQINGQSHFYLYQEMTNGFYEFQEVTPYIVDYFIKSKNFNSSYIRNITKIMK